ncbi:amidase [Pusillimonas noertemannii]|uniref:amidase n=1 Tax=Pusillimonas noertemannii TaxID=305977 RepID=UPI00031E5943|nr:amidase [Pusillimonas noertemannii]
MDQEVLDWSASRVVAAIRQNKLSAQEYMRETIARIKDKEPSVRAWRCWSEPLAMEKARRVDAGAREGLLAGIPIGVKDIIDTVDYPTAYGSPIYERHQPTADAACVALLQEAGGIVLGKTVTTEFAYFQPGPTANPHDVAHTPGGSSSGSAAAVAAGMVPLALGSQTAGSLIRPASYCGVWGYKPSYGLFGLAGVRPMAQSLDTLGVLARHAEDLGLMARALIRGDRLGTNPEQPLSIGVCHGPDWAHAGDDTARALDEAARSLSRAGVKVSTLELPAPFMQLTQAQRVIQAFEAARTLTAERLAQAGQLSPSIRQLIAEGLAHSEQEYIDAQGLAAQCRQALDELFRPHDAILAPSAPGEAPSGLEATGDPIFSRLWMPLHLPCVNMPFERGAHGLPVGVQLIANYLCDGRLLGIAAWAERSLDIRVRPV